MSAEDNTEYKAPISEDLAATHVSSMMTKKIATATAGTTVRSAINMMLTHKVSGLPVVDSQGKCLGIYSELDAMLQGSSGTLDSAIKFKKSPITVLGDARFKDALVLLVTKKVKRLPVVDERGFLIGIISRRDFMRALYEDQE